MVVHKLQNTLDLETVNETAGIHFYEVKMIPWTKR